MKKLGIIMFVLVFFTACNSRTKVKDKDPKNKTVVTASNNGKNPDVKIKVKKTYDKNGNMVGYDSTYFYSYTNSKGNLKEYNIVHPDFSGLQPHRMQFSPVPGPLRLKVRAFC